MGNDGDDDNDDDDDDDDDNVMILFTHCSQKHQTLES